jgi:hypothetical protein
MLKFVPPHRLDKDLQKPHGDANFEQNFERVCAAHKKFPCPGGEAF